DGALIPTHRPEIAYPPLALFEPLAKVREPFRIVAPANDLVPNIATMYGLEDARGATAMTFAPLAVPAFPIWPAGDLTRPMLSMMNVRYAITGVTEPIPPGWHEVTVDHRSRLIENEHVLPRAFVPRHTRGSQNEIDEMDRETDFAERGWIDTPHPAFGHLLPASGENGARNASIESPSPALAGEGGGRPGEGDAANG